MKTILQALRLFILLALLTGGVYPLTVTLLGKLFFPEQTSGSLVTTNGKIRGSRLLAQKFIRPHYFHPRPSATDYATIPSGASNLGPTNAKFQRTMDEMRAASGSGLDPHISPQAARAQIPRVAQARGIPPERLEALIDAFTEPPQWGLFGEPRVNVLMLNLRLDE